MLKTFPTDTTYETNYFSCRSSSPCSQWTERKDTNVVTITESTLLSIGVKVQVRSACNRYEKHKVWRIVSSILLCGKATFLCCRNPWRTNQHLRWYRSWAPRDCSTKNFIEMWSLRDHIVRSSILQIAASAEFPGDESFFSNAAQSTFAVQNQFSLIMAH